MTPAQEATGGAVFRAIHDQVIEAGYASVEISLADDNPLTLADAVLGATLAALLDRGWLLIPERKPS
jgi:hypothetical protein